MKRLRLRRAFSVVVLLALSFGTVWEWRRLGPVLPHLVYLTGWILLALMLALTVFNARKKLPFLPLISARAWLQVHIYGGLFTGLAFLLHTNWHAPAGGFERVLATLFWGVTVSGIVGWWISRMMPKRLTAAGGDVPYERIPIARRELRVRAEALALEAIPEARATTLADFYARELSAFFAERENFWSNLSASRRPENVLLGKLDETRRYFTAREQKNADEMASLIRQKGAVDFQQAGQLILKGWLFVHIPLTYGLLVFSAVHVVIVYAFSGGAR